MEHIKEFTKLLFQGDFDAAEELFQEFPDINAPLNEEGTNVLMAAAKMGKPKVVEKLLSWGANTNLTDKKGWHSVAFPAISTGIFGISLTTCAEAFKKAIPYFWEKYPKTTIDAVWLCLLKEDFTEFKKILE